MKLIFLDTETTGSNPQLNAIVQLAGSIRVDGKVVKEFNIKMKPHQGAAIEFNNDMAQKHKLSPEKALEKFTSVMEEFVNPYNKTDKFYFVAYNSKFDEDFVRALFARNGNKYYGSYFWNPSLDVMQLALYQMMKSETRSDIENMKLGTVAKYYGVKVDSKQLHDAAYDAKVLRNLYNKIVNQLKK